MLTRRHLRIKTMQALYAYVQSDLNDAQLGLRRLEDSIKAINDLYLYELRIFWHFRHFLEERLEIEQGKQFPNRLREAQLTHFLSLPFFSQLAADEGITKSWEQNRVHWGESSDVLRKIFFAYWAEWGETLIWNSPELQSQEVQISHLRQFYRDFLANNEDLQQHYESLNMHWSDDLDAAQMMVVQTMQNARKNKPLLVPLIKNQEDFDFAKELFLHTLRHSAEWQQQMAKKAKQWDYERMAPVDRSIVQMALSEVIAFPQIPIKVTIDEAIELAKQYGSPKAAAFVNGILDAVVADLKSEGRIQKLGRGLIGS